MSNRRTQLTPAEMVELDDGQGWYKEGDTVYIGGCLEDPPYSDVTNNDNAVLDLCVNGKTHDNWTYFHDLPESIQSRLLGEQDNG